MEIKIKSFILKNANSIFGQEISKNRTIVKSLKTKNGKKTMKTGNTGQRRAREIK